MNIILNPFLQGFLWILTGMMILTIEVYTKAVSEFIAKIGFICVIGGVIIFLAGFLV